MTKKEPVVVKITGLVDAESGSVLSVKLQGKATIRQVGFVLEAASFLYEDKEVEFDEEISISELAAAEDDADVTEAEVDAAAGESADDEGASGAESDDGEDATDPDDAETEEGEDDSFLDIPVDEDESEPGDDDYGDDAEVTADAN